MVCALMLTSDRSVAQGDIENVVVETYYISDENDASDVTGGGLNAGSRTYRVFIDLGPGRGLRALYGSSTHPLSIGTTTGFFNHADRGRTFGHQINNGALDEGTTALDSWLSMGAASNQRRGIQKADDVDGSIVGGSQNDGGSAAIPGGLLVNDDPTAGTPLTERDGLMVLGDQPALPPTFISSGDDITTTFGDTHSTGGLHSGDVRVACSTPGMHGDETDNIILVAQLTTTGELSFQLNVEIERPDGSVRRYVATDTALAGDETPFGLLNWPPACGCMDPQFLEYDPLAGCDDGSCQTAIVFGCTDPAACNFDPTANFHIGALCCYGPDSCSGLDITVVCPALGVPDAPMPARALVHPNPATDEVFIDVPAGWHAGDAVQLLDLSGRSVIMHTVGASTPTPYRLVLDGLSSGTYLLRFGGATDMRTHVLVHP